MKKYLALLLILALVLSTAGCKKEREQGSGEDSFQDSAISNYGSDLSDHSIEEESDKNSFEDIREESRDESSEESDESETAPVTEGSEPPLPEESMTLEDSSDSPCLSLEEFRA